MEGGEQTGMAIAAATHADASTIRTTRRNGSARLFLFISRLFNSNVKVGESNHPRPVYRIFYDLRPINFKMLRIYFFRADIYITVTHLQII